jgi:hypothetical protein
VAQGLQAQVTPKHLWCGRHVKVIDGSTVSMPDTEANQKIYPQPSTQSSGCGFPIAKIGVLFSLATGAAIALVIDVLNTHDVKLARRLYEFLNPNPDSTSFFNHYFIRCRNLFHVRVGKTLRFPLGCGTTLKTSQNYFGNGCVT